MDVCVGWTAGIAVDGMGIIVPVFAKLGEAAGVPGVACTVVGEAGLVDVRRDTMASVVLGDGCAENSTVGVNFVTNEVAAVAVGSASGAKLSAATVLDSRF